MRSFLLSQILLAGVVSLTFVTGAQALPIVLDPCTAKDGSCTWAFASTLNLKGGTDQEKSVVDPWTSAAAVLKDQVLASSEIGAGGIFSGMEGSTAESQWADWFWLEGGDTKSKTADIVFNWTLEGILTSGSLSYYTELLSSSGPVIGGLLAEVFSDTPQKVHLSGSFTQSINYDEKVLRLFSLQGQGVFDLVASITSIGIPDGAKLHTGSGTEFKNTPEPASLLLVVTGLAGSVANRWWKSRMNRA